MDEGIPFEDVPPDEKIIILADAHRFGIEQTDSEFGSEAAEIDRDWVCVECLGLFTIEDLLVVDGGPQCPRCRARGWDVVHPRPLRPG